MGTGQHVNGSATDLPTNNLYIPAPDSDDKAMEYERPEFLPTLQRTVFAKGLSCIFNVALSPEMLPATVHSGAHLHLSRSRIEEQGPRFVMELLIASSPVQTKHLHLRPSLHECVPLCDVKERKPRESRRIISGPFLHPVDSAQLVPLSPVSRNSLVRPSTSAISFSGASFSGRSRRSLSDFDSRALISFSSSVLFNSLPSNLPLEMRKRAEKGRAENVGLRSSVLTNEEETIAEDRTTDEDRPDDSGGNGGDNGGGEGGGGGGGGGDAVGWVSSALMFAGWVGLILYAFTIAPNQTQFRDTYFIEKLLNLHSDDGFIMNKVLVAEWYFMGLWPVIYSSLMIPNGRSRKNGVKVWPFATLSFFVGAFALLPYFGLWRPPPPKVSRDELRRYPLNVLESKVTAAAVVIGGIVLAWYAGSAGGDQWVEFLQYLQESRFINVMSIDFLTLSALAPFWVYNDLSARQRSSTSSWLPSIAIVPFFGPALYLLLRPALVSAATIDVSERTSDSNGSA